MSEIDLRFRPEFREAMLTGRKLMTTRTRPYGVPGDTFHAFGALFEIDMVVRLELEEVARHFLLEGLQSREQFLEIWRKIHPIRGYRAHDLVFAHRFKRIQFQYRIRDEASQLLRDETSQLQEDQK